jgi:hypothetical protein
MHTLLGTVCADDEAAFQSLPFRGQFSLQKYIGECAYLRTYAAEFACRRAFPDGQDANVILTEFFAVMENDPGFVDPSVRVSAEAFERTYAYFQAVYVRREGDAMMRLGTTFAGFFPGQAENLHLAVLGASMFGTFAKHAEPLLRRYRLQIPPPSEDDDD